MQKKTTINLNSYNINSCMGYIKIVAVTPVA